MLWYGQITHTCAMSSYSYVLFRNVSLSLNPEMLWKKEAEDIRTRKKRRTTTHVSFLETSGSYLQTLDGREECERQGEGHGGAEFAQLSPWCSAPVDGSSVAHLQHQVHGSLAATTRSRNAVSLEPQHGVTAGLTVVPAVGDLTDDVKGFLEVDGVRNHLQRQSDVSVSWCLCEKEGRWNRKTRIN